jgi:arsenite oxidase small subunit
MERRDFLRVCASGIAAAGVPSGLASQKLTPQAYARTKLVDPQGKPLRASAIPAHKNLIFLYPFASTPCFLLNLGKPVKPRAGLKTASNQDYQWPGGVGRSNSVVAYSAICAHQLAYPTKQISFISYRQQASVQNKHAEVIHCCAEHSQYDPADGGRVLAGPAPQPLAAILLEHDAKTDELHAVGTLGGDMFNQFFAKYEFKLALEHSNARQAVAGTAVVSELDTYCRQQVRC